MSTAIPVWQILVFLGVFLVATSAWGWFRDQYEVTWDGRLPRFTRRWYGTRALVILRAPSCMGERDRCYSVLAWDDEAGAVPWLLVTDTDDEDAEAFWAAVTDFAPHAVRRLRPHLARFGRILLPQLHVWLPLRQPAGYTEADA